MNVHDPHPMMHTEYRYEELLDIWREIWPTINEVSGETVLGEFFDAFDGAVQAVLHRRPAGARSWSAPADDPGMVINTYADGTIKMHAEGAIDPGAGGAAALRISDHAWTCIYDVVVPALLRAHATR